MKLVLHRGKEGFRGLGLRVVVDAGLFVEVGDLEVEASLARSNLADALDELVEVVFAEPLIELEPLVIEDEAFGDELVEGSGRLDAELGRLLGIDPVAHRDDRVEGVMLDTVGFAVGGSLCNFCTN